MKKIKNIIYIIILFLIIFIPTQGQALETGKVTGDFVTVRKSDSTNASSLGKVIYGTKVTIISESGDFYKIIYDGLNTGYMSKKYILKESEYKLDDKAYCEQLKNAGFPDTYCPYLSYLHAKHPNWIFTPLITNLDFYKDVVDGEEGKNYIQSTEDAYRASDKLMEAGGWYTANQTVTAYMLDPRNFLHEKTIFMFESLGYTELSNAKDVLKSIFGTDSFLVTKKDTDGSSYLDYYIDAGKTYKVSPIHLAARTKQEGASSETYGAVSGTYTGVYNNKNLKGFYNFYNIGAYADSVTKNPMLRGIAYAAGYTSASQTNLSYGRPWDTRKKAIYGGANFIAGKYISKGQNTLYFEKFNTNPFGENSLYTSQYMTNIFAPYSEGYNVKNSYEKASILDVSYNFTIPVYTNMPIETLQPTLLSGNNILSGIYVNGELIPGFDGDITEYEMYFLDSVEKVSISAISNSADAKIEGDGEILLTQEENIILIKVTAENGDVLEYKIKIKKVKDTTHVEEIIAKLGVKEKDKYLFGIQTGINAEALISSAQKISPSARVSIQDNLGNEKKDKVLVTGDKMIIKTLVDDAVVYTIAINGDLNSDGIINIQDLLKIQKHLLGTNTLKDEYALSADNNFDGKITSQDLLRIQKCILGSLTL